MYTFLQKLAFTFTALLLLTHCLANNANIFLSQQDRTLSGKHYKLVWSDEFNGSSLNKAVWTYEKKPAGWVNHELQNYVKNQNVVSVSDGTLKITCFKKNRKIYSGRIYAKRDTGWKYGYFEARIKLPKGKGTWPAFWMMPVNTTAWPGDGEIDIMEEVGAVPNEVSSTIHCTKYNNTGSSLEHAALNIRTAESDFHTYGMAWNEANMTFFVDGKQLLKYDNDGTGFDAWPFDKPFYLILNLAWGGDWGGMHGVDERALPATMEVDYVRVYQLK